MYKIACPNWFAFGILKKVGSTETQKYEFESIDTSRMSLVVDLEELDSKEINPIKTTRDIVEIGLQEKGLGASEIKDIKLAVSELASNALEHGEKARVAIEENDSGMIIAIESDADSVEKTTSSANVEERLSSKEDIYGSLSELEIATDALDFVIKHLPKRGRGRQIVKEICENNERLDHDTLFDHSSGRRLEVLSVAY